MTQISIEQLWGEDFHPNPNQHAAIHHVTGPLYLPAGPGSGKTRVLLWRTVNLIVCHSVKPHEIFLSTFTEKAAGQLREGLRALLGAASNYTHQQYDLSGMYVGTVHSLCQRLVLDRNFSPKGVRSQAPYLLDELGQYFHLHEKERWISFLSAAGLSQDSEQAVNGWFSNSSASRHKAVTNVISLFNRISEECLDVTQLMTLEQDEPTLALLRMYQAYLASLNEGNARKIDFSLLQQDALNVLKQNPSSGHVFKHVIVDEYQDTNTVQEQIFFRLANGHKNLCVVGDDDQALYRFRGATVENFVDFPARCHRELGVAPTEIQLTNNYRSRQRIVSIYTQFMKECDWSHNDDSQKHYRVITKQIKADSQDAGVSVVTSNYASLETVCQEIAQLVRQLIDEHVVQDPNQIAFLFPSLKSNGTMNVGVAHMKRALEEQGLRIYAPRAGRFIDVDESVDMLGLFLKILGAPARDRTDRPGADPFGTWLANAQDRAEELVNNDKALEQFVKDKQTEIQIALKDYQSLTAVITTHGWQLDQPFDLQTMKRALADAPALSSTAYQTLANAAFEKAIARRANSSDPYTLRYVINRLTSLDWNVLDLFYRLCGFKHFIAMFDLAQGNADGSATRDEGPICNLALLSQYLARALDELGGGLITANGLQGGFQLRFFGSFIYALFQRGESEFEDAEDRFPSGRIPFLTIHQSKGLEFPVVVMPSLTYKNFKPSTVENFIYKHVAASENREPIHRINEFDAMRKFYVGLSRAQNLLVLGRFRGQGHSLFAPFKTILDGDFPHIRDLDLKSLPIATQHDQQLPRNYSYTGDYMFYQKCARQYMIFRKYGFVASRSQTMMFGSLVHRTIEDLHHLLIYERHNDEAAH